MKKMNVTVSVDGARQVKMKGVELDEDTRAGKRELSYDQCFDTLQGLFKGGDVVIKKDKA